MDTSNNTTISKLVLLYFFFFLEIPLTEETILKSCCSENEWISYITCREVMVDLIDSGFILEMGKSTSDKAAKNTKEKHYSITADGRACLSYFFSKIPISLRDDISAYVKANLIKFKRQQEYSHTFNANADGSYTVLLKIVEPLGTKLELKLNVANRGIAKQIVNRWEQKASDVYANIYETLIDN